MAASRKRRKKRRLPSPVMNSADLDIYKGNKKRKGPKVLTLAIMGGAAFFAIKSGSKASDNDGDGYFYQSVDACVADDNPREACTAAWDNAKAAFEQEASLPLTWAACYERYESCTYDAPRRTWVPVMAGFLLAKRQKPDEDQQSHSTYYHGGSVYSSRPVWRNTSGDYAWRSRSKSSVNGYATRSVKTLSRGGFGRASGSHSSWGG